MTRILLAGATGRLGREISASALERNIPITPLKREDVADFAHCFNGLTQKNRENLIILDVSLPEGTEAIANELAKIEDLSLLRAVVVGTTGHSSALTQKLTMLSQRTPVVVSSNFSRGVFLFEELLQARTSSGKTVADLAKHLGFDLALWESHHTLKKDAPSGTAKTLANAAGVPNERIASTRVGAVVGEHTLFLSQGSEELRFSHMAHSRRLFADGAVNFCERLFQQSLDKGFYTMSVALNRLMQIN